MAFISKNSKISVNNKETRYAAFKDKTVVLNDEYINVWGYNDNHEFWFQCEKSLIDPDEPYLKRWFYKQALEKSEKEGKHSLLYMYKYIYRCYKEMHEGISKRTIWYKGHKTKFENVTTTETQGTETDGTKAPCLMLKIPMLQFYTHRGDDADKAAICSRFSEISDECAMLGVENFFSNSVPNGYFELVVPTVEQLADCKGTIEENINEVHALIAEHCKFTDEFGTVHGVTPENILQINDADALIETKVRVAKVLHDWAKINMPYAEKYKDPESGLTSGAPWWVYSLFGALAKRSVVCNGFARYFNMFLQQYGIESIVAYPNGGSDYAHAWNIVNYHDEIGEYSSDNTKWCEIDGTRGVLFDGFDWRAFNTADSMQSPDRSNIYVLEPTLYSIARTADEEHQYTGDKHYAW